MNYTEDKKIYLDEDLRETKIVMENYVLKLYVPPEYLMILMTKYQSDTDLTCWDYLKTVLDRFIGENFETIQEELRDWIIDYLNHIYSECQTELNVMKAIKEGLK